MSLAKILNELRAWRARPSQRQRIAARPLDREVLDPVPMAIPVGYETPPTMTELIQRYVRLEVSQAASENNQGTFDEEDDFELVEHSPLPFEQYQVNEYKMSEDPDMPTTAPVEDPPPVASGDDDAAPAASPSAATDPPAATQ